jgi:DNA-binding response OmpR family regulator
MYRILLVDDDLDVVEVIRRGLEHKGLQLDAYVSSDEALHYFEPNKYDFAILDIRMPALTGFQLYREMKKLDSTITACFLSAFEVHPNEFKTMFPSMSEVKTIIKKPVSTNDLLREITPLLKRSRISRAVSGEHFLVAFETPQELIEQSLHFLKIGLLENDEDILLVTDELPKNTICKKIIKDWNVNLKNLEHDGRIKLMTFTEWHLIDGKFDIQRSKTMMIKMVRKALDQGRTGFRLVVDMNPFFSKDMIQHLMTWESSLEEQFDLPITSLCAYTKHNIQQFDNPTLATIQQHHGRMLTE